MENTDQNINKQPSTLPEANSEYSIFDEVKQPLHLYPRNYIYALSILFGTLFGSILMAINFNKTEEKKGIGLVILFGIFVIIIHTTTIQVIHNNGFFISLFFNIAGGYILKGMFWSKYIGDNTVYYDRSVFVPVIIVLAVVLVYVFLAIFVGLM